ncbi:hypothetical protein HDU93_000937 [Gonapodya sp. JEL0774]|nr:hypothetical protein HDU93_000937 [Gonapodya sp. JEL0774]
MASGLLSLAMPAKQNPLFPQNSFHNVARLVRSLIFDVKILGPTLSDLKQWIDLEHRLLSACGDTLRCVRFERTRGGVSPLHADTSGRPVGNGFHPRSPTTLDLDCYLSSTFPHSYLMLTPMLARTDRLVINAVRPNFLPLPLFSPSEPSVLPPRTHPLHLAHLRLCVSISSIALTTLVDMLTVPTSYVTSLDCTVYSPVLLLKLARGIKGLKRIRLKYSYPDVVRELVRGNGDIEGWDLGEITFAGNEWLEWSHFPATTQDGDHITDPAPLVRYNATLQTRALSAIQQLLGKDVVESRLLGSPRATAATSAQRMWTAERLVFRDGGGLLVSVFELKGNQWEVGR